jgi:hypothetical protein
MGPVAPAGAGADQAPAPTRPRAGQARPGQAVVAVQVGRNRLSRIPVQLGIPAGYAFHDRGRFQRIGAVVYLVGVLGRVAGGAV